MSSSRVLRAPVTSSYHLVPKRSVMMILNLSESLAKPLVMAKLNMEYLSSLTNRAKLLLSSLPVSPSRVLRAPRHLIVPFGAKAPSGHAAQAWAIPLTSWGLLSQWHQQQTTMPETKQSVPRPNPATFLRDFTLYMTSNDAILWKRCLNYITCLTH